MYVIHVVLAWYTWYVCGTPGTCLVHLILMWYTWYLLGTPDMYLVHLIPMWYTWHLLGTPDTYVVHLVFVCHRGTPRTNHQINLIKTNHQQYISTWLICNSCRASAKNTGYLIIGRWIGEVSRKVALFSLLNQLSWKVCQGKKIVELKYLNGALGAAFTSSVQMFSSLKRSPTSCKE